MARRGQAVAAWPGPAWLGSAAQGMAWLGGHGTGAFPGTPVSGDAHRLSSLATSDGG